jgi:hypothetical protein
MKILNTFFYANLAARAIALVISAAFILAFAASIAGADTVFMKDGATLDGNIVQNDSSLVVVEVGKGRMSIPASDVLRVEKNDKKGTPTGISIIQAQKHNEDLDQRTGLSAQKRDAVRAAIEPLWSPDEAVRNTARKKLVAMNKDMDIFKYLESYLPYSKGIVVQEIMQTLVDIDPAKAKDVILPFTQSSTPENRAKALEIAGSFKNDDDIETIARGLVDSDNSVRIAAAHAVANAEGKRATPALIESLKNPDPKVQNAAKDALKTLWGGGNIESAEQWTELWNSKSGEVKNPIDTSSLEPLVSQEELSGTTASHDE